MHPLRDILRIDNPPASHLVGVGKIFATFGEATQDSGNISYGVEISGKRLFVKTAGEPSDTRWLLPHFKRVELLQNAVRLANSCNSPAVPKLFNVIDSPHGPMLIYEWLEGTVLTHRSPAWDRFVALPSAEILAALDVIYDLNEQLADRGWVACDFYDASVIYDFASRRAYIVDLDAYHAGPFTNPMGRMFGSSRFMAPEEFQLGATIDQRTTVFALGQAALVFLSGGNQFRGDKALLDVVHRACEPVPSERFQTVRYFARAWRGARKRHSGSIVHA